MKQLRRKQLLESQLSNQTDGQNGVELTQQQAQDEDDAADDGDDVGEIDGDVELSEQPSVPVVSVLPTIPEEEDRGTGSVTIVPFSLPVPSDYDSDRFLLTEEDPAALEELQRERVQDILDYMVRQPNPNPVIHNHLEYHTY